MHEKLYRAGLIPYTFNAGVIKFLLMRPSDSKYGGPEFQIAKGKIEEGETEEQAAIREAQEELGLVISNTRNLEFLGNYLGRTSIFMCEVDDTTLFEEPCGETGETRWMTLQEFDLAGRNLHLHIIQDATRALQSHLTLV